MICKYHKDGRVGYFTVGAEPQEHEGWFNSPDEASAAVAKEAAKKTADVTIATAAKK